VTWSGAKGGGPVSAVYATADVTATAGSDYTAKSGTVTMSNSCRCGTISVPILGDTMTEGTETFRLDLSSPTNGTIGDAQAIGTIFDNEGPPAVVVLDGSADEGAGNISFDLIMTSSSLSTQTVDYATVDGTATAGSDYTSTAGTMTFPSGQTTATIVVPITNDTLNEADEVFSLALGNSTVAVTDGSAVGSIFNDDAEPTISVADATAAELGGTLSFTISLSTASGQEVDVDYTTTDGSATGGSDFAAATGTATIPAGATSTQVDITLTDDTTYEGDEGLTLDLTAPFNASIADAQGAGTVQDDDSLPAASIDDVQVVEGNAGSTAATFTVSLANASAFPVTVDWAASDATATAGIDFTAAGGTVSFVPGATSAEAVVDVTGDTAAELNETFAVTLTNPSGASVADATGIGTITDDDRTPTSLTLKVTKAHTKVGAKGVLEIATSGATVSVSLYRHKGAKWIKLSARTVAVSRLGDRDADGRADGLYRAAFPRPAKGSYRLRASFAGSSTLLPTLKIVPFTL
jgi:chitinase